MVLRGVYPRLLCVPTGLRWRVLGVENWLKLAATGSQLVSHEAPNDVLGCLGKAEAMRQTPLLDISNYVLAHVDRMRKPFLLGGALDLDLGRMRALRPPTAPQLTPAREGLRLNLPFMAAVAPQLPHLGAALRILYVHLTIESFGHKWLIILA